MKYLSVLIFYFFPGSGFSSAPLTLPDRVGLSKCSLGITQFDQYCNQKSKEDFSPCVNGAHCA